MTLDEAISVRTRQLQGEAASPRLLEQAIAVIAGSIKKRRNRAYGTTPKGLRATDNQQVKMLKAELRGAE